MTMFVWIGGLLFASAAVLAAQALSRYVALRCVEIIANMKASYPASRSGEFRTSKTIDDIGAQYIRARMVEKQLRQGNRREKTESPLSLKEVKLSGAVPFGDIPHMLDGLDSTRLTLSANGHTANAKP